MFDQIKITITMMYPFIHYSIIPLGIFIPSPLCPLCVLCGKPSAIRFSRGAVSGEY